MGLTCTSEPQSLPTGAQTTGDVLVETTGGEPENPQFDVRKCHGKGLGIIANSLLKQGARILSEMPILQICGKECLQYKEERDIFKKSGIVPDAFESFLRCRLQKLDEKAAQAFWALSDSSNASSQSACGIVDTNSVRLAEASIGSKHEDEDSEDVLDFAVFAVGSRFNHSCTPNVHFAWSATQNTMSFYALRDIEIGTELCICYSNRALMYPAVTRQQMLRPWRFQCACCSCSSTGQAKVESDTRRTMLLQYMSALQLCHTPQLVDPDQSRCFMQAIEELRDRYAKDPMEGVQVAMYVSTLLDMELEGHPPSQRLAYSRGYEFAMKAGNKELALELGQSALLQSRIADRDSPMTRQLEKRLSDSTEVDS